MVPHCTIAVAAITKVDATYQRCAAQEHDGIADELNSPNVPPGNSKHWRHLLPADAGMVHEDEPGCSQTIRNQGMSS